MTRRIAASLVCLLVFCLPAAHARNMLIRGGTLIPGTDQPPVRDARILVEGNTIRRVWSGDSVPQSLPPDTQVINAEGKFIIPGLIDSHIHYGPYMGELFLAYGVTTIYDLGNPINWQIAAKKALNSGQVRGPRLYFCSGITFLEGGGSGRRGPSIRERDMVTMRRPDEAARVVAEMRKYSDCVKLNEDVKGDFFEPIAREAHAAGLNVISHSFNAVDSAKWGINGVEHMVGVAVSTIRSREGRDAVAKMNLEAGHKNSLLYQWMEPAVFDEVIHDLVSRKVMLNPTLHFEWKALTEHAHEHEMEDTRLLNDPNLQYMPLSERLVTLGQYHWPDKRSSGERELYLKGYRRVQEFLSRFVKAGGKLYSGTDSAAATTPGLSLHQEMELYVDAGITPRDAIRSSTQWAAEILGLDKQLGTVEPSKLADLVILRSNPLDDIRATKDIDTVIQNGEVIDTAFHSDYSFPFRMYGPVSKHLYNPVPVLSDMTPPMTPQGSEVTIRVLGRGFVPSSAAFIGDAALPTKWISPTELSVQLTRAETASIGTVMIRVETPLPGGGATEPLEFYITFP